MRTMFVLAVVMLGSAAFECASLARPAAAAAPEVEVVRRDADRRVDVLVDGKPFTSYIYPTTLRTPVLFPLRTDKGTLVTRGFPLEPRRGERVDHPHHVGMWLNHGDVEGVDFWDAVPPSGDKRYSNRPTMGDVVHKVIKDAEGGAGRGRLSVGADWVLPGDRTALREETAYTFHAAAGRRAVDRVTTLAAADGPIKFGDTKEGMFAIRVARALEHPSQKPDVLVGADGKPGQEKIVRNGANGHYRSSEGVEGEEVWGTGLPGRTAGGITRPPPPALGGRPGE